LYFIGVARRRPELLALAIRAELVVRGTLLGVLERLVRLGHLLELLLGVLLLGDVRMVLARELAVGRLDLVRARLALEPEDAVIVLVSHRSSVVSMRIIANPAAMRSFIIVRLIRSPS
jgi:hypothetical protein